MAKLTKVRCKNCDKIFYRPGGKFNEAVKMSWNQFCSLECQYKFRTKERKILTCKNCGKKFERLPKAISEHNYCSHSCSAIVVNKNWSDKRNGAVLKCPNCKKIFKRWLIGSNKKYCSKACQTDAELYTKEKLIKIIKGAAKKLKRVPARREFWGGVDKACMRLFGSWNKAISEAGFIPNRSHDNRMYKRIVAKAKDGHSCDSVSELLIDNWLYKNRIAHERDTHYPNTNHKTDWKIFAKEKEIFVEYFGLANDSPRYDRCIKEKIKLCDINKITLIAIYPKDLYPKNFLEENLRIKFKDYLVS
ncbi:MAG: hypothetical protein NTV36_03240 [Candidatus Staskawiczbacteria bacterium]|nr:hypothetical protein [Candidatus Staskawiczbacteria bacterium]